MKYISYIRYALIILAVVAAGIFYCKGGMTDGRDKDAFISSDADETDMAEEESTKEVVVSSDSTESMEVVVQICGCVTNPGVFRVGDGTRVYEVVDMAGGMTTEADVTAVNQAHTVSDGQQIYIPAIGEKCTESGDGNVTEASDTDGRININTADTETLMSLPGIGRSKADAIIRYRDDNGRYGTIEDIMNVSGIKQAAFDKIKDLICV